MTDIAEPPTESGKLSEIEAIAEAEGISLSAKPESFGRQAWKRFRSHKLAIVGSITLTLLVATFFIGPYISPYEFDEINVLDRSQGPSSKHWFGTDDIGRDLFVRSMKGGQFSMRISVLTGLMAAALGGILGALAGYLSGIVDTAISFLINTLLTVNSLAVLLILGIKFRITPVSMAVLLSLLIWYRGGRVTRALTLQYKEREFVLAAKAAGAGTGRILFKHLLPNVAGALLVEATLLAGTAIILESTLSFLGLGVQPPATTLGTLINEAKGSIDTRPYRVLIPGGIVTLIVLAINFLGDGLRDALDPTHEADL